MFQKGEYVIHGVNGACQIVDLTQLSMPGNKEKRLYYVLRPVNSASSKIYFPVGSDKVPMRKILTRKEAETLLEELREIQAVSIPNEKLREETYKEIMRTCDCRKWVSLLKTLFSKRLERQAQGRKFTSVDERYFKAAEENICSELSLVFGVDREIAREKFIARMHEARVSC